MSTTANVDKLSSGKRRKRIPKKAEATSVISTRVTLELQSLIKDIAAMQNTSPSHLIADILDKDISRMVASYRRSKLVRSFVSKIPFILLGLFGGLGLAMTIDRFKEPVLALFGFN